MEKSKTAHGKRTRYDRARLANAILCTSNGRRISKKACSRSSRRTGRKSNSKAPRRIKLPSIRRTDLQSVRAWKDGLQIRPTQDPAPYFGADPLTLAFQRLNRFRQMGKGRVGLQRLPERP